MPTIEENRNYWSSDYDWSNRGQEWNQGYGGTQNCWEWCVHPRIRSLLPTGHILELAPGYGELEDVPGGQQRTEDGRAHV